MPFKPYLVVIVALLALVGCGRSDDKAPVIFHPLLEGHPVSAEADNVTWTADNDGAPVAVASDEKSNIWIALNAQASGKPSRAFFRFSDSSGDKDSWKTVGDSDGPTHEGLTNNAIAMDQNGSIYVGQTYKSGSRTIANFHYTHDLGLTWKDVSYQFSENGSQTLQSVALSPGGQPFFAGNYTDSHGTTGFVVTLQNDKPVLVGFSTGTINQAAVDSRNTLYIAGTVGSSNLPNTKDQWLVTRSAEFGKNFGELEVKGPDLSSLAAPVAGRAQSVLVTRGAPNLRGNQNVFVGGVPDDNSKGWTVKLSLDAGQTYSDADLFTTKKAPTFKSLALSSLYDYGGYPIAVGYGVDVDSEDQYGNTMAPLSHWVIRAGESNGNWHTVISTSEETEKSRAVGAASVKSYGRLIVVGDSYDKAGAHHLLVRTVEQAPFAPSHR